MNDLLKQRQQIGRALRPDADDAVILEPGLTELHDRQCKLLNDNAEFKDEVFDIPIDPVTLLPTTVGEHFNRDGRTWRVTVVTDTFIIATDTSAKRDRHNEPVNADDVIKINRSDT